ncbi:hypothetical protein D3C78_1400910 [compost metagenome]
MAIGAEGRLGQLDDPVDVEKRQPQRIAVEHALVMVAQAAVVPVLGLEAVDRRAQGGDPGSIQHSRQQDETVAVQCLQTAGGQGCQEFAGGHVVPPSNANTCRSCWHCIGGLARAIGQPAGARIKPMIEPPGLE